jgi:triosephosphate isomerase
MRKKIIAGNWKMNKTIAEITPFFESFSKEMQSLAKMKNRSVSNEKVETVIAVPFLQLQEAKKAATSFGNITVAAQNVHFELSGAFTGEISASMLGEIGVKMTLVGHSERRQYFGETDETVTKKVKTCLSNRITPIICVGETKEERLAGITNDILSRQVSAVLSAVENPTEVIFAYEPVWAIGTGLTATQDQAQDAHFYIRQLLHRRYGDLSSRVSILYGGSATPQNIEGLLDQPDIDGGLVGGASLKPVDFAKMVDAALSYVTK